MKTKTKLLWTEQTTKHSCKGTEELRKGTITLKDEQGKYYDPYLTDEEKLKVIVLQVT